MMNQRATPPCRVVRDDPGDLRDQALREARSMLERMPTGKLLTVLAILAKHATPVAVCLRVVGKGGVA